MTLQERLQTARRPGGYDPGDTLELAVKDAGGVEHTTGFEIESYCGGGFAGQVYRARCTNSTMPDLRVGQSYALKFFVTRSSMRRRFRNLLYWVAFQSPFPHQYNEAAVRAGLGFPLSASNARRALDSAVNRPRSDMNLALLRWSAC